jgi:hypothetical protein
VNKFYTRRTANILNIAGWVFTIAAWPLPRPWDSLSAVTALGVFFCSLHIRSYLDGYERGLIHGAAKEAQLHFGALGNERKYHSDKADWTPLTEQDWLGNNTFTAKTFRENLDRELNRGLAADKAEG